MTRFRTTWLSLLVLLVAATFVAVAYASGSGGSSDGGRSQVRVSDDCDPTDASWNAVGGCNQEEGSVTRAEFNAELNSPLSLSVVGHQAWRMDPSYAKVEAGDAIRLQNTGGRAHTFTEVAAFGGGVVPPLNKGLTPAPECATSTTIAPGGRATIAGLTTGNHRYQCCFHPWMRALIKVGAGDAD